MIKFVLMLFICNMTFAKAETTPYLLQQIQVAQPDADAIAKAKKQVSELKEIKLQKISLVPFHLRKQQPINASQVYCTECHGAIPHQKRLRSRAFLNMHTDYVACETCHYRPENTTLTYRWYDYQQEALIPGSPAFFHSGRKKADNTTPVKTSLEAMQSRDGHIKIVPVLNQQAIIASRNHPEAKKLYQTWKDGNLEQKAKLKAQYHLPLKTKGPECNACHNDLQAATQTKTEIDGQTIIKVVQPPMLDYAALGAAAEQQTAIRQNSIADFFGHYQADKASDEQTNAMASDSLVSDPTKEERIRITNFLK